MGLYGLVIVVEAPDEETVTAALLSLGAVGNVRTQTLRGVSVEEMKRLIAKMPRRLVTETLTSDSGKRETKPSKIVYQVMFAKCRLLPRNFECRRTRKPLLSTSI